MVQVAFITPTTAANAFYERGRHDFLCGEDFLRRLETYTPYRTSASSRWARDAASPVAMGL
eukprot:6053268-Prymnesium_polylepis.1